jgi:hypothetical protein
MVKICFWSLKNGVDRRSSSVFVVWKMEPIDGRDLFSKFGKWSRSTVEICLQSLEKWRKSTIEIYFQSWNNRADRLLRLIDIVG